MTEAGSELMPTAAESEAEAEEEAVACILLCLLRDPKTPVVEQLLAKTLLMPELLLELGSENLTLFSPAEPSPLSPDIILKEIIKNCLKPLCKIRRNVSKKEKKIVHSDLGRA